MNEINRILLAAFMVLAVAASGCTADQMMEDNQSDNLTDNQTDNLTENQTNGEPDPNVTSTQIQDGILEDLIGEESTVEVSVINEGAEGDINVTLEVVDEQGNMIFEDYQEVSMAANETRVIEFDIQEVPPGAVDVRANATPV